MSWQKFPAKAKSPTKSTKGKKANKKRNILLWNEIRPRIKKIEFQTYFVFEFWNQHYLTINTCWNWFIFDLYSEKLSLIMRLLRRIFNYPMISFFPYINHFYAFNGPWPNKVKFVEKVQSLVFHKEFLVNRQTLGWKRSFRFFRIRILVFLIFTDFCRRETYLIFKYFSLHFSIYEELKKLIFQTLMKANMCRASNLYFYKIINFELFDMKIFEFINR